MAIALSTPTTDETITTGRILALFVPVLSLADLGAVYKYSTTIEWNILKQLALPILLGLCIGVYFIGYLKDDLIRVLAGYALLALSFLHFSHPYISTSQLPLPKFHDSNSKTSLKRWLGLLRACVFGLFIGYFTIISNIAGPIAVTYLIQLGIQKNELNGTRSCLFLLINCIKIPCQIYLGNLQFTDVMMIVSLCFIAIIFTIVTASYIMPHIQQRNFDTITWVLVIVSAFKLILKL